VQLSDPAITLIVVGVAVVLWGSVLSYIVIRRWEHADKATNPPPREWHEEVTDWERHAHEPEQRDYREHARRFEDWE